MRDCGCYLHEDGLQIPRERLDVDIGQVDDGEGAEGEGMFGVGNGGDEVLVSMLIALCRWIEGE